MSDHFDNPFSFERPDSSESGSPADSSPPAFCTTCGARLQETQFCSQCEQKTQSLEQTVVGKKPQGTIKSALLLYFVLLFTIFIQFVDIDSIGLQLFVSALDAVIVLVWCIFSWKSILPVLKLPKPGWIVLGALSGFATYFLTTLFLAGLILLTNMRRIEMTPEYFEAGYGLGVVFLAIVAQPAIIEELAFRGIIYHSLLKILTKTEALIVSALMFAALHISVFNFPHTFVIGSIAVILIWKSGSLWPGVALHAIHNSLAISDEIWF